MKETHKQLKLHWNVLRWHVRYIYSLLIEKDIGDQWNISVKLPCVYEYFSYGELNFFRKSYLSLSLFSCYCVSRTSVLSLSTWNIYMLESIRFFFFAFQWSALVWGDLEPSYACMNFSPPVKSIRWWQAAYESGSV
jgi:hypothetical protein